MVNRITAHSSIQDFGQMIDTIFLTTEGTIPELKCEDFECTNCFKNTGGFVPTKGVTGVEVQGNTVVLTTEPFLGRSEYEIRCEKLDVTINKSTINEMKLYHEDLFTPVVENGVRYRLYEPNAYGPRPLILFLHGGGASGEDNIDQLVDTLGPIKLAERVPDMYVLAPQAPSGGIDPSKLSAMLSRNLFLVKYGEDTANGPSDRGWTRDYLGRVTDLIRKMIAEGKVDPKRVYVTGLSMGGCGTIKVVATAPDLFAACVPICPSMNGETLPILENFPDVPIYIASAYIDHQKSRHAYILRAVQKLWEAGRTNVKFILFTEEELAAYGIGRNPNVSASELYAENHNSWIPVYHNEYGILDWMFSHIKE